MKKQLTGTTALVAVGLLIGSGVGQKAEAADPLELSIGGYYNLALEYRDEDDSVLPAGAGFTATNLEPGGNLHEFDILDDGEIQFTASTTLDNGIGVKARIEYEAINQGGGATIVDERWVQFSGAFGALKLGSDDNVANAMHYQAPAGNFLIGPNTPSYALVSAGLNQVGSTPGTYINTAGDAHKIIYFSPRIAGFQLGLSYAPDGSTNDGQGVRRDDDAGGQEDIFSVGLNFVESFGDVSVAVSGGYITANLEKDAAASIGGSLNLTSGGTEAHVLTVTSADDAEAWSAGLNVGFSGFTVGASVKDTNQELSGNNDNFTWDAGISYATGPIVIGFTYLHAETEVGGAGASFSDDEADILSLSGTYTMGPGVEIWGGIKYFEYDGGSATDVAHVDGADNEGYILSLGTSVSF